MRPDVLANRDADALAAKLDDDRSGRRLEVAVLVEHVVSRQQAFAGRDQDFALMAERRGIESRPALAGRIGLGVADDSGDRSDLLRQFAGDAFDVGHEALFEQEIARRVAADDQFGENDQLGALRDQGLVGRFDQKAVSGKIADDGVDLGQADAHGRAQIDGKGRPCNPKSRTPTDFVMARSRLL